MKNPFRHREPKPIPIQLSPLTVTHTVRHEYGVRPKPTSAYLMLRNNQGEQYIVPTFSIYPGMADVLFQNFPVAFLTGRPEEAETHAEVRLHIDFG